MTAPRMLFAAAAAAVVVAIAVVGCAPVGAASEVVEPSVTPVMPLFDAYPDTRVIEDLDYGAGADGVLLDVCLPSDDAPPIAVGTDEPETSQPRAAVLVVHGGRWRQGDKANDSWRSTCRWLASEGFVAFSVNYRLAPEHPFPAAIDDLRTAVRWIRGDARVNRFDIDPARVGVLGGSAGGNLAALLGLGGEAALDTGSRVSAVVELSGPADLTTAGFRLGAMAPGFRMIQLEYLGCADYDQCPQARDASPLYEVDGSDPPFFVAHSIGERIPIAQSDALVAELREAGVDTTYVTVDGMLHSIAMLDSGLRDRVSGWLRAKLAP